MIKKFSLHCIEKVLFFIGIFLLTSEILKQLLLTFVVNNGHYNLWYFPFQLCSLPMYLLVLYPFFHTEPARNTILASFPPIIFSVELPFFSIPVECIIASDPDSSLLSLAYFTNCHRNPVRYISRLQKSVPMTPLSCSKILKDSRLTLLHAVCCLLFPHHFALYSVCSHRRISEPHSGSLW